MEGKGSIKVERPWDCRDHGRGWGTGKNNPDRNICSAFILGDAKRDHLIPQKVSLTCSCFLWLRTAFMVIISEAQENWGRVTGSRRSRWPDGRGSAMSNGVTGAK